MTQLMQYLCFAALILLLSQIVTWLWGRLDYRGPQRRQKRRQNAIMQAKAWIKLHHNSQQGVWPPAPNQFRSWKTDESEDNRTS